jgi:hypothetical protein
MNRRLKIKQRMHWWIEQHWPTPDPADQKTRTLIVIQVRKAIVAAYIWMFILTLASGFAIEIAERAATRTALDKVHQQATLTCQRSNTTRATDNAAHLQTYQLFQYLLVARAARNQLRKSKRLKVTKAEQVAITHLRQGQRTASWAPLINCAAVHEAKVAVSLRPIAFSKELPPASALNSNNAVRIDPTGSVG